MLSPGRDTQPDCNTRVHSPAVRNYQAGGISGLVPSDFVSQLWDIDPKMTQDECRCNFPNIVLHFSLNKTDRGILTAFCLIAMYSVDVVA